jgi:hypothetical protein
MPRRSSVVAALGVALAGALAAASTACRIESRPPARVLAADSAARATATARREVRAVLERYYDALSARDWPRLRDHFWPGATLSVVWQPPSAAAPLLETVTVDTFIARAPQGPGSKPIFEERLNWVTITIHRNLAHAWASYRARFGDSARVDTWEGFDAFTLMRHDGVWRIAALAYADR